MKKSLLFVVIALFAGFTAKAADGDTFRIDVGDGEDKIWMTLKVLSEEQKTAEVSLVENSFGTVDIPSTVTHDEVTYTVVSIGNQAFKNQVDLVKVIIPNTVTTIGVSAFEGCTALGANNNYVGFPTKLTTIGAHAFENCTFYDTPIPTTVTSVGVDAFKGTAWLNNQPDGVVYINNTLYAYKGEMPENTTVSIEEGTTTVLENAFKDCEGLVNIEIPSSITSIAVNAFGGCSNVTKVTFHCQTIGSWFAGFASITSIVMGDEVKTIDNYAFSGCSHLNILLLSNNLKSIGAYAFSACMSLNSITLPASVAEISNNAFVGCDNMNSVTVLNETPISITSTTFSNVANSTLRVPQGPAFPAYLAADNWKDFGTITYAPGTVTFDVTAKPSTSALLEAIGEEFARYYCDIKLVGSINSYDMMVMRNKMVDLLRLNLADVSIVANSYNYGTGVSEENVFPDFLKTTKLTSLVLPNNITSLGNYALSGSTLQLEEIAIPASVTSFGAHAFNGSNIKRVNLAENSLLESIGNFAFQNCKNLQSIPVSESLTSIGWMAFAYTSFSNLNLQFAKHVSISTYAFHTCSNLTSVTIKNADLADYAFMNCTNLTTIDIDVNNLTNKSINGCKKISTVTISASSIPQDVFKGYPIRTLTIGRGVIEDYAFQNMTSLTTVRFKEGVTKIGASAFLRDENLQSIGTLPESLESIGSQAFYECTNLRGDVVFPKNITEIPKYCFYKCNISSVKLSPNTTNIGTYAFWNCNVTEIRLPSTLRQIGDYAFSGNANLNTVYAYMPDVITIGNTTFSNYQSSTLHIPSFLYYSYYWDQNWSQFSNVVRCDLQPGDYETFYTNSDVLFAEGEERITTDTPIATIDSQGSITVEGEAQAFDTVDQTVDDDYSASLIGDGEAAADNNIPMNELRVNISVAAKKWYFFCFPFDVTIAECTYPGRYAWRSYDGAVRAANGSGGWQVVSGATLSARQGYAFQSETAGTLTVRFTSPTFGGNRTRDLEVHNASSAQNASWNFVGNPYSSYYDFGTDDITSPITVWNGTSYTAYRPGDDELHLRPYEAFFVQKPEAADVINFNAVRRESYRKSQQVSANRAAARRVEGKSDDRLFLNLTISDNDTALVDRTRLVVNEKATVSYELERDAAKFLSTDAVAQIYMIENGQMMAIDERPAMGDVSVGYVAREKGTLRIEAQRMDLPVVLYDRVANKEFDLADGAYEFTTAAGTFNNRFVLRLSGEATAIRNVAKNVDVSISMTDGGLVIGNADAQTIEIYTLGGSLVGRQVGNGTVSLSRGIYVVKVNGVSTKVGVN